jgi:hypothetical protein
MSEAAGAQPKAAAGEECCASAAKRSWASPRAVLVALALAGGGGALVLGWDWLLAAGLGTVLIAAAPCLVMCALGICAHRMSGNRKT